MLWEADDPEAAARWLATSQEPFDRRFREFLQEVHGIDIAKDPPPPVRPVIDHRF